MTDKKTEALKLALEALNTPRPLDSYPPLWRAYKETINKAITAIREALAEQPAQQQEPVAWMHTNAIGHVYFRKNPQDKTLNPVPLYTSPPPRKPLTDEEIWDEVKAADLDWQTGWSLDEDAPNRYITFARAIEAANGIARE